MAGYNGIQLFVVGVLLFLLIARPIYVSPTANRFRWVLDIGVFVGTIPIARVPNAGVGVEVGEREC